MLSLYGVSVNCLVDTGSTHFPKISAPLYGTVDWLMADGSMVFVIGKVDIYATIDSEISTLKIYVANIDAAAILGMDFFRNHYCVEKMCHLGQCTIS